MGMVFVVLYKRGKHQKTVKVGVVKIYCAVANCIRGLVLVISNVSTNSIYCKHAKPGLITSIVCNDYKTNGSIIIRIASAYLL